MPYRVFVENDAYKDFPTIAESIQYASKKVYLPQPSMDYVVSQLKANKSATWAYGFTSVTIEPQ